MNKKIVLMTIMFGASVCSQLMFAIARPADIIINNTQEDVEYFIECSDDNVIINQMLSGIIPAGDRETFYGTQQCSREARRMIAAQGLTSKRAGFINNPPDYGIDFRYFTIENSPDNSKELVITISRGTNYGVREDLESSPMVKEGNE